MSNHICIPSEDLKDLIESGVNEAVREVVRRVHDHLESAHDDDATGLSDLDAVSESIRENGWTVEDLELEVDIYDVHRAIRDNGWTASDLELASTNMLEAVSEHGAQEAIDAIIKCERDAGNDLVAVMSQLWLALKPDARERFLSSVGASVTDEAKIRETVRGELLGKLAAILA